MTAVPTATIALLLLFIKSSYCYVPSLSVSFTLGDSKRTIPLPSDHSQQWSQQCCGLTLAATNDPVAPLPLAFASEMERKLVELERKLEKVEAERKLEKAEAERKLEKAEAERKLEMAEADRKLEKSEMQRKQGK